MHNHDYLTVQSDGFITYCDALIARFINDTAQSFLFSLVGSPAQVQAASAHFYSGRQCRVTGTDDTAFGLVRGDGTVRSIRAKKIGDTVNKVMISADHFPGAMKDSSLPVSTAVVFGPDMDSVINSAFLRLTAGTTMPLKPEWRQWLWEEILQPEKLYSFGSRQLTEAWSISWQEEDLQRLILEGIRQKYLI